MSSSLVPFQGRNALAAARPSEPVIGSTAPDAITIGRLVDPARGIAERLRYGGQQGVVVIGPNGKGKGTRLLMPNLLQNRGASLVVVDPKGELAAVTAPFRRTLGPVVVLNPFGVLTDIPGYEDLRSFGYNPLAHLNPASPSFNTEASQLADAIVTVDGKEPHWGMSARALLAALIMHTVIKCNQVGEMPSMAHVRALLCQPSEEPNAGNNFEGVGIPKLAYEMMESNILGLRNKAAQFTDWNREIQSIASTARVQTECFDDYQIATDMHHDGFNFSALKYQPITVYLILPPNMMHRHAKWLRLVLTSAIQAVLHVRRPGEPKTIFMLDEFFALGHLEIMETVWALVRGYGVQMMPILQDINQLKKLYPDMWETFLGMAGVVASFAPNDLNTAKWLSERAGETTREISTTTEQVRGVNESVSTSPQKTALVTPHRLFGLRTGYMIASVDGLSNLVPIYAPPYYEIRQCDERARENPYHFG